MGLANHHRVFVKDFAEVSTSVDGLQMSEKAVKSSPAVFGVTSKTADSCQAGSMTSPVWSCGKEDEVEVYAVEGDLMML